MRKIIVAVTGTPGTGKSTFARELAEKVKASAVIEINDVVKRRRLYSRTDRFGSRIVNIKRLDAAMVEEIGKVDKGVVVVVGHLVPELHMHPNMIIVLRTGLVELSERLEKRRYPKGKIRENLVAEATDYCGVQSRKICKNTYEVENDADKRRMVSYVDDVSAGIRTKGPERKEIDKLHDLFSLIKNGNRYGL